jgi:carbamoyl-phosphate synthase large subunit
MTIAITGLNANDNPGPGVAVARALRDEFGPGLRIVGLCYEPLEPGVYLHALIDTVYLIPYPGAGIAALQERIKEITQKELIDIIIPNFDSELYNFIKIAPWLKTLGISSFLPNHQQLADRDKPNLARFGQQHGFSVPRDVKLNNVNDIQQAVEEIGFPLVVKGRLYEAVICHSKEVAQKAFHELSAKWGTPVIAQEFIKGAEINIAGLGDGEGNAISVIPMRKLYITEKGKAWAGVTIEDAALLKLARKFASVTQWRGGFEMEIIRDATGNLFILEINPRFPAWVYLTAGAGQNQPAALVKLALGEYAEPFTEYMAGKMFIRYSWDELVDIADFQQFSAFGELGMNKVLS